MNTDENVEKIYRTWDYEEGFFGKLRQGYFDKFLYQELFNLLLSMSDNSDECVNKSLVSLLWFMPVLMHRQKEIVCKNFSIKEYNKYQEDLIDAIAGILGYP